MDFGIHWLELTIWDDAEAIMAAVESAVLDRDDVPGWCGVWTSSDLTGRLLARHEAIRGIDVLDYADDGYCGLRIKGAACEILGSKLLGLLLGAFPGVRCRASRIDLAWDGLELSPRDIEDRINDGDVRTRAKFDSWFNRNAEGDTCYSHNTPMRRGIERWFRVYNRRGDVRFEWVLRGDHAAKLGDQLLERDPADWCSFGLSALRGFVDFLDPTHDVVNKPDRRLDPSWAALVASAAKWRPDMDLAGKRDQTADEALASHDEKIRRASVAIQEHIEAFGLDDLISVVRATASGQVDFKRVDLIQRGLAQRSDPRSGYFPDLPF